MNATRLVNLLFLILLLASAASGATLHGKVYDVELNELNDVIVSVDSEPAQRFVSKNGTYSFELKPGTYMITANYSKDCYGGCVSTESVTIADDGDFVYDLFIFPTIDKEDSDILSDQDVLDLSESVMDDNGIGGALTLAIIVVCGIILLLLAYLLVGRARHREQETELKEAGRLEARARQSLKQELEEAGMHRGYEPAGKAAEEMEDDLNKLIELIRSEGGRTTQKELRRHFPMSEAKISLMISELEHKKIVQKVKKGRGNIIILRKKK